MRAVRYLLVPSVSVLFLLGACQPQENPASGEQDAGPAADRQAAVEEIRQLDRRWIEMVESKDTAGIVELYVEGTGRIMPPGSPAAAGEEGLRQFWSAAVNFPHLAFGPDTIIVSDGGDMAVDIGSVTFRPPGAESDVQGKYVVVWVRQDDEWKILADIFNTDGTSPASN